MSERDEQPKAGMSDTANAVAAHVRECDDCRADNPPVERIVTLLNASRVPLDAGALSHRVLLQLQPELSRVAAGSLWRRAAAAVLLALVPLPAVLAYDAYLLRLAYGLVSSVLPATLAAYVIGSYAAFLLLVFASTYAVIPVFLAGQTAARGRLFGPQTVG